jgi:hypothetical protein
MAFGMMVNRFGLLRSPLQISVHQIGPLLQWVVKLHNYMLDENNSYKAQVCKKESLVPTTREEEEIGSRATNVDLPQPIHGISATRQMLVNRVKAAGLARQYLSCYITILLSSWLSNSSMEMGDLRTTLLCLQCVLL